MIRTHDVKASVDAARMADAILRSLLIIPSIGFLVKKKFGRSFSFRAIASLP